MDSCRECGLWEDDLLLSIIMCECGSGKCTQCCTCEFDKVEESIDEDEGTEEIL